MLNAETRQKLGVQYQVETELPITYNPAIILAILETIPHVQKVAFVREGSGNHVYLDCVITVDSHSDNSTLWDIIKNKFNKAVA